jgi:hypothetical protein
MHNLNVFILSTAINFQYVIAEKEINNEPFISKTPNTIG